MPWRASSWACKSKCASGNLDARRDWGFAGDYVRAMWLMLQQDKPDDYVICDRRDAHVRELCEVAFAHVGLNWEKHIVVDPQFIPPGRSGSADWRSGKAGRQLGWEPKVGFQGTGADDGGCRPERHSGIEVGSLRRMHLPTETRRFARE